MLKNLLHDDEKIVDMLVDKYKLMTEQQARDLLESSLNPYEVRGIRTKKSERFGLSKKML